MCVKFALHVNITHNTIKKKLQPPQPNSSSTKIDKSLPVWESESQDDYDKDFIIEGIKHGFKLVDSEVENIDRVSSQNHERALVNSAKVEERIQEEVIEAIM